MPELRRIKGKKTKHKVSKGSKQPLNTPEDRLHRALVEVLMKVGWLRRDARPTVEETLGYAANFVTIDDLVWLTNFKDKVMRENPEAEFREQLQSDLLGDDDEIPF